MEVQTMRLERYEAQRMYHTYLKNKVHQRPEDEEIKRTYRLISEGKTVIQALASIKSAGLNEQGLPKLAIGRATAEWVLCHMRPNGGCEFTEKRFPKWNSKERLTFAAGTFPSPKTIKSAWDAARAMVPIIPPQHRPQRALENYHILWEAEWERIPPKDPYLLQRLGKGDLWLVLAAWDLTPVEQAAMATRVFNG